MDEKIFDPYADVLKEISFTIQEKAVRGAELAAQRISKAGEAKIREFVETRGLNKIWKNSYESSRSGKIRDRSGPSRVDSGMMRDSIDGNITTSKDIVTIAMGWFDPDSDAENPINYQEFGFDLENGEEIPGMNSLEDTLIFIQENIWSLIEPNEILQFGPATTRGGGEAPF